MTLCTIQYTHKDCFKYYELEKGEHYLPCNGK